jgi:hypothetical protein
MQHVLCRSVEQSPQTNPIVARIDRKSGHGCGRSTQKIVRTSLLICTETIFFFSTHSLALILFCA